MHFFYPGEVSRHKDVAENFPTGKYFNYPINIHIKKFSTIKSAVNSQNDSINSWTNSHAQDSRPLHRSPSFCHTSITLQGKSKATTVARARI